VVLGYGSARHGTYHPKCGAPESVAPLPRLFNAPPSASSKFSSATSLSSAAQAAATQAVDITRDVALKAIPKKKVKGNEESVWGEMRFLQGLDHPNIVRPISPRAIYLAPSSLHTARALML
jgi:hypothetical protein